MFALFLSPDKLSLMPPDVMQETYDLLDGSNIRSAMNGIQNARHYRFVCLDVEQFSEDSAEEICGVLSFYRSVNSTPLIVLAQGRAPGDSFLKLLIEHQLYNFVTAHETIPFQEQFANCLRGRSVEDVAEYIGVSKPLAETRKPSKFSLFQRSPPKTKETPRKKLHTVTVAVAGVYPRMGTTTQALRLTRALLNTGQKACYIECNTSGHIAILQEVFSGAEQHQPGFVTYEEIPMYYGGVIPQENIYSYTICDCGNDLEGTFQQADYKILIAGSAAWEMAALAEILACIQEKETDIRFLFSFTGREEENDIRDFMERRWMNTWFASYAPDMFSKLSTEETDTYKKIITTLTRKENQK